MSADNDKRLFRFKVSPAGSSPLPPEPAAGAAPTGGLFTTPGPLLAFPRGIAGVRLADAARCRRSPDGLTWWAEVEAAPTRAAVLVEVAGGRAFAPAKGRWTAVPPTTTLLRAVSPNAWPDLELAELVGSV